MFSRRLFGCEEIVLGAEHAETEKNKIAVCSRDGIGGRIFVRRSKNGLNLEKSPHGGMEIRRTQWEMRDGPTVLRPPSTGSSPRI